ncbi:tape measure protein [Endozoicomonas atrinae]|uniref:tape measure protein n=1 Tax=Endozoicomonas atrinae TaxID=1333660 RepID=UPI0008264BD7|nr:tape measure protein [Endozoicomonas atrinae]
MASNNSVLNIVIRARDLAKGALTKVTARLRTMGRASQQTEHRFASLGRSIRNLVLTSVGFYAIKKAMQGVLNTGDQFERLEVQLNAIMGSMAEGEQAMAWIKEFTKNTPLELQEVADAFTALKNFGLDPMDGTLQAIVDQTSKLGGGMERLKGISLALGQAWAKQKLQGEEILQLVERGVPVWSLLEKVTGKNTQELQKLSSAGKLGREAIKGLIDGIGKSSAGAAKANMGLLSGLMSNMADRWTEFKDSVADAGWLDYVKTQLTAFGNKLDELGKNGKLQELAQKISDGFISMAESVRLSLASISFEQFVQGATEAFNSVSTVLGKMRSAFQFTSNTIKFFFNSFLVVVKGFASAYTGILYGVVKVWQEVTDALGLDGIAEKLKGTMDYLKSLTKEFASQAANDANDVKDSLTGIWDTFAEESEAAISKSTDTVKTMTDSQKLLWQNYADELIAKQKDIQEEVTNTADTAKGAFKDAAEAMAQISNADTRTELASLGVALAEAFSRGELSLEEYTAATEASRQKLQQLKDQAEMTGDALSKVGKTSENVSQQHNAAMGESATIAGAMAGHYNHLNAELQGMSSSAREAFEKMNSVGDIDTSESQGSVAALKKELEGTNEELNKLQHNYSFDITGIDDWMTDTAQNAAYVKKQFLEQKIALEELLTGYDNGEVSARRMAREGQSAAYSMQLLNEQDLSQLDSAIQQAESSMESLNSSARNTLDGLQNELDRLQGKQDQIEKRQHQSRQRDLKNQLEEARAGGNQQSIQDLSKALRLNDAIYREKRNQLAAEQRAEQLQKLPSQRENSRINPPPQSAHSKQADKIIRLEYPGGSVNVGVNRSDESKLLEALKNAGLRSV